MPAGASERGTRAQRNVSTWFYRIRTWWWKRQAKRYGENIALPAQTSASPRWFRLGTGQLARVRLAPCAARERSCSDDERCQAKQGRAQCRRV